MNLNEWTLTNLDKSPAMTETKTPFTGSFEEAVEAVKVLWHKITNEIGRTSVCVHSGPHAVYYYYRIDFDGNFTNRNRVPYTTGKI